MFFHPQWLNIQPAMIQPRFKAAVIRDSCHPQQQSSIAVVSLSSCQLEQLSILAVVIRASCHPHQLSSIAVVICCICLLQQLSTVAIDCLSSCHPCQLSSVAVVSLSSCQLQPLCILAAVNCNSCLLQPLSVHPCQLSPLPVVNSSSCHLWYRARHCTTKMLITRSLDVLVRSRLSDHQLQLVESNRALDINGKMFEAVSTTCFREKGVGLFQNQKRSKIVEGRD